MMKSCFIFILLTFFALLQAQEFQLFVEPVDGNILNWRGYKRIFHSIAGSPCGLTFKFETPTGKNNKFPSSRFRVFVPEGVKTEEILVQYTLRSGFRTTFDLKPEVQKTKDGVWYCFDLERFLEINSQFPWARKKEITFYWEPVSGKTDRSYQINYASSFRGGKEKNGTFQLKFIPMPRKGALPEHFRLNNSVQLWQLNVRDPELLQKISRKYQISGLDSRSLDTIALPHNIKTEERLRKAGWRFHTSLYTSLIRYRRDMAKNIRIKPALLASGKQSMTYHCPTDTLKNTPLIRKAYAFDSFHIKNGDVLCLDNEPFGYWDHACFCNACLDRFSEQFKIPRSQLVSPDVIRTKFASQWLRHLCLLQCENVKIAADIFRKKFPDSRIVVYNYFLDFNNPEKVFTSLKACPQDPRDYDDFVDCHQVSAYVSNGKLYVEQLKKQRRYLKKPVAVSLSLDRGIGEGEGYLPQSETVSPAGTRLKILAAASLGGTDICIYSGLYFDGKVFEECARAMQEIAVLENYYLRGEDAPDVSVKIDPEWDKKHEDECLGDFLSFTARSMKGNTLVTLFNFNRELPVKAQIHSGNTPAEFYVSDPVNKILYTCNGSARWNKDSLIQDFRVTLKPEDAGFLLLSSQPPAETGYRKENIRGRMSVAARKNTGADLEKQLKEEYERICGMLNVPVQSKAWHNSSVKVLKNGLQIQTPVQQAVIDYNSGLLSGWKTGKGHVIFQGTVSDKWNFGSGNVWSLIHTPAFYSKKFTGAHLRYIPVEISISDEGRVFIRLGLLHEKLYLEKSFIFEPDSPVIRVAVTLENLSGSSIRCGQWFRMCLPGGDHNLMLSGKKLKILPGNNYYAENFKNEKLRQHNTYWSGYSGSMLTARIAGGVLALDFSASPVDRINVYQGQKLQTLELFMPERSLAPLKKNRYNLSINYQEGE